MSIMSSTSRYLLTTGVPDTLGDQMIGIMAFAFTLLGSLRLIGLLGELAERAPAVRTG